MGDKLLVFFINQAAFAGAEMNILPNFGAPKKLHFKEKRHGKIVLKFLYLDIPRSKNVPFRGRVIKNYVSSAAKSLRRQKV